MSRSGYTDENDDNWSLICWRGAVTSAIRGARGQALLREMLEALDAMPTKRLISGELEKDGEHCALGAVGAKRGMDMSDIDPDEYEQVASRFGIAEALAREIEYINDDWAHETPERRWVRVHKWVAENIIAGIPK